MLPICRGWTYQKLLLGVPFFFFCTNTKATNTDVHAAVRRKPITTALRNGFCVARTQRTDWSSQIKEHFVLNASEFTSILPPIQDRDEFGMMCEQMGYRTGLEIGVQRGLYSKTLLSNWPSCNKLYLMDAWESQRTYSDLANVPDFRQQKFMMAAKRNMQRFQNEDSTRVEFIRGFSNMMHDRFPNASLDFVYIDARHDYCGVYEDLSLYYPKVSCGGVLAGHDYLSADEVNYLSKGQDWSLCANGLRRLGAVREAVNRFAIEVRSQVLATYRERYHFTSWYMRKHCW